MVEQPKQLCPLTTHLPVPVFWSTGRYILQADLSLRAGYSAPSLGVTGAVKDSYLTQGLTTTFGTSVLATFKPARDALAVARVTDAGAIVFFGKNNLVEMSYGLTGLNEHHGQVRTTGGTFAMPNVSS
jgi:Asp-tRNA(Asn)/Glu-tRNA(Gln) amidotransferase A subunit family amidase